MKKIVLMIMFFIALSSFSFAESDGECGFQILKVGTSASMSGKGDAVSASSGDATILWYNPAAVQLSKNSNFCFSHSSYIFENDIENASLIVRKGNYSYGFGAIFLNYGKIDCYDENPYDINDKIGEYHPIDILLAGNFSFRFLPNLLCGSNLKIIHEKIHTESSWGLATDFGLIYDSFLRGLNFAIVAQNLGFSSKMKSENIKFPNTYKLGTSYTFQMEEKSEFSLSTDFIKYIDNDDIKINLGFEYSFTKLFFARLGYKFNYDEEDFSAGLGIKLTKYNFDYSFVPYQNEIGNVHRFSIAYNF